MSEQLTLGDIVELVHALIGFGMTEPELRNLPIYIGDDDELNGIHTAWYVDICYENDPNCADIVEMINESSHNIKFKDKAIVIK